MDRYAIAWTVWILAFVAIEAAAVFDAKPGGTFSEGVWAFLEGGPSRYVLIGACLLWLTIHFLGRGRWG